MKNSGPITVRLDPSRIPQPKGQDKTEEQRFADELAEAQSVESNLPQARVTPQRIDSRNPQLPAQQAQQLQGGAEDQPEPEALEPELPQRQRSARQELAQTTTHPEEGSDWRIIAGKQPGPSSALSQNPQVEAAAGLAGRAPAPSQSPALPVSPGRTSPALEALGRLSRSNRGADPSPMSFPQARLGGQLRRGAATNPAPTARLYDQKMLAQAEQARASIFKQLAMQLSKDGGQVMMRIDPPELGKLDLRMVVEKGQVRQLSIAAERPEVAQVIDRHMPELRSLLEQEGLSLEGADISTQDFGSQTREDFGSPNQQGDDPAATGSDSPDPQTTPRSQLISAEGLDFWI